MLCWSATYRDVDRRMTWSRPMVFLILLCLTCVHSQQPNPPADLESGVERWKAAGEEKEAAAAAAGSRRDKRSTDDVASSSSIESHRLARNEGPPLNKNFLRFGRADLDRNFLRFGRGSGGRLAGNFLRYGRYNGLSKNFLRFGRRQPLEGAKDDQDHLQVKRARPWSSSSSAVTGGKRTGSKLERNFVRFGKRNERLIAHNDYR